MKTSEKWAFVLIGNDRTGKTTFQKHVVNIFTDQQRHQRLDCDLIFKISHPEISIKINSLMIGNRSIQERIPKAFLSIQEYFEKHFKDADICIISSHLSMANLKEIIDSCHKKFYNIGAVFFSNSIGNSNTSELNRDASLLQWDRRFLVTNPLQEDQKVIDEQIRLAAESFSEMIIKRSSTW